MTRAEEALFVGGALGARENEPAPDQLVRAARAAVRWRAAGRRCLGLAARTGRTRAGAAEVCERPDAERPPLPPWATTPIGPEPRPPRPLAPSAAGQDEGADPPFPPGSDSFAARRGVLIHQLLERLPEVPPLRARRTRARLARAAGARRAEEASARRCSHRRWRCSSEPGWADIFGPAALAEVPLAATVEGQVVAGTADRLLVEKERVLVVDFKTARRPPAGLAEVPLSTLRQMAAYAAALAVIYPGRRIEAALLYTQTPLLVPIPPEVLAEHKAALSPAQESYPA